MNVVEEYQQAMARAISRETVSRDASRCGLNPDPKHCPCCLGKPQGSIQTFSLRVLCEACYHRAVRLMTCPHEVERRAA